MGKIGIKVDIKELDSSEIKKTIRDRDYTILLFGEKLGGIPDPLPFWHSSQIVDPGLNIAVYENTDADQFLEKARTYADPGAEERKKLWKLSKHFNQRPAGYFPLFLFQRLYHKQRY